MKNYLQEVRKIWGEGKYDVQEVTTGFRMAADLTEKLPLPDFPPRILPRVTPDHPLYSLMN